MASPGFFQKPIYRGDTLTRKITITAGGSPIDITGWKLWVTLKKNFDDPDSSAVLQFGALAGDNPGDNPSAGEIWLQIPAAMTTEIEPGKYVYDVQLVVPGSPPEVGVG
ncbi:hypothetical protein CCP3SC15_3950001 [Gammaproteobacteria bacterium]